MRLYQTALTIALGCIFWRVSGKLLEVVVRPGDNATLHCDRETVGGQDTRWVKTCSSQIQPPLIISAQKTLLLPIPRFTMFLNITSKSYDLMIENVTEADLGLYYCSSVEKQIIEHNRLPFDIEVYHIGDALTKLAYAKSDVIESSCSNEAHQDSVSDCWQCWLILLTAGPACFIVSASLAFLCGKCCHKKVFKKSRRFPSISEIQRQEQIQEQDDIEEICYTSLNIPKQGSKLRRSIQIPNTENSVYNDIKLSK